MIDEDELILFRVLANRAGVTEPGYVIPKLADAVHRLLAEVERLKYNVTAGRMTCDISKDLREWTSGDPAFGKLLVEAADKLDDLITSLAKAETARDEHRDRAEAASNLHANAERLLSEARAEAERLVGQRDKVLYRMARYRADTMLGSQIRDIYNDVVYCAHEWPAQDTRLPEHKCALPAGHAGDHLCWCGVASLAEVTAACA